MHNAARPHGRQNFYVRREQVNQNTAAAADRLQTRIAKDTARPRRRGRGLLRRGLLSVGLALTLTGVGLPSRCVGPAFLRDVSAAQAAPEMPGGRQSLRSPVNPGGPENWPPEKFLSTTRGAGPGPASATPPSGTPAEGDRPSPDPAAQPPAAVAAPSPKGTSPQTAPQGTPPERASRSGPEQPTAPGIRPSAKAAAPGAPSPAAPGAVAPVQPSPSASASSQAAAPPPATAGSPEVSGKVSGKVLGLPEKTPEKEEAATTEAPRPVVYVDEQGNPVPKPADPAKMLAEAERLLQERKYDEALPQLEQIRNLPNLTPEQREATLYHISDCLWARYVNDPLAGFEPIVSATSEAMHANLRSPRVPDALLRLGLANVNVGNLVDAGGYLAALYRRYPDYPGVAQGFTALGQAQMAKGRNAAAEQSFALVLDKYPESSALMEASVGLATALHQQQKYDKAQLILDFISKRWPRHYIDQPDFLLLQARNNEALGHPEAALPMYWLYHNLVPKAKGTDALLLKMGDMYSRLGADKAADFVYTRTRDLFPGTLAAWVARLRLAEGGIYDAPISYAAMSQVFARAADKNMPKFYSELASAGGEAPQAVLARLKEAMWQYWNGHYTEAMGKAADFIDAYPENSCVPQARDLIWMAFQKELANALAEGNYGRILILWNGFPLVRERYGQPDPRLRYALAQGLLERGEEKRALEMLSPFLASPMNPQYGEGAFVTFFNRYLQAGAWDKILDLGRLVSTWPLRPQLRNQLDYAMALSAQNLNLNGPALAMWHKLADKPDIPLYQRAYATYFLARDAEQRKDIAAAYQLNRKVVELFTRLHDERSDKADPQRIKDAMLALMDICEVGNRVPEALQWLARYNAFVPQNSPEYPGLRFREARLYRKLGDATRAQMLLEAIVRDYKDSPFAQAAAAELRTFAVSRDLQSFMPGNAPTSPAAGTADSGAASGAASGQTSAQNPAQPPAPSAPSASQSK